MANTDQSGNHTGESSESARIVVANGQDIDKQYYHEVAKRMARDWDLRKLAYLGPPLWAVLSIGVVLWAGKTLFTRLRELFGNVLHTATVIGSGGIIGKSPQIITDYAPHILAGAVLLLFVIIPLFLVIKRFSSEGASSFDLLKLLVGSLKLFNPGIWQKSNYWNPFTSHLSDRDPLVVLAHQTDAQVSGIYSDEPHYGNVFVDSVFVTIEGDLNPVQRFRSRLLLGLYDYRLRWARRGLFALFGGIVFLWGVDPMVEMTTTPFDQIIPWKELTIMSVLLGVTMLVLLTLTRYPLFLVRFFAESAGLSRYKRLLNKPDTLTPTTNERTGPGNSLSGYGLFFVSEFLYSLFGYVRYDVSVNESYLLPSGDRSDERSDGAGSDTVNEGDGEAERTAETDSEYADSAPGEEQTTKSDGDDEDSPFPPLGIDDPNEAHATVAARELLWSAVPRDSVRAGGADADVSIMINGVDYYTINDEYIRRLGRLKLRLAKLRGKDVTVESERALERTHAGEKIGFRLPVKKFMSVPHGFPTEKINEPPGSEPDLYLFDDPDAGDLQWEEDTIHYLLLGGGEHQQGINKLILSMKAAGYENVDVLENAFASVTPFEESASQDGVVDWTWERFRQPGKPVNPNGLEKANFFPTEYFVSGVFGGTRFFRQKNNAFLLLRYELDPKTNTESDQTVVYHVVIGMSAVGTKVGFLYWLDQYDSGFPDIEEDVAYCIQHPGPTDIDGLEDVGHLYLNSSWRDSEPSPLEFTRTRVDEAAFRFDESSVADQSDLEAETDDGVQADPNTVTDGSGRADSSVDSEETKNPLNRRRLRVEYCQLDLAYDPTRS